MKKKIGSCILITALAIISAFNINLNSNTKKFSVLSLNNIEALASEIDYNVPHKNNNPQKCTLYLDAEGNFHLDSSDIKAGLSFRKVNGMENYCEEVKNGKETHGCDPYECHQRVG